MREIDQNVLICRWNNACRYLRQAREVGSPYEAVISIRDEPDAKPSMAELEQAAGGKPILRIHASDVTPLSEPRFPAEWFKESDLLDLAEFADSTRRVNRILIHCDRGNSRAPAAAMILLALRYRMGGAPADAASDSAVRAVRLVRPTARPNWWMLALADAAFGLRLAHCSLHQGSLPKGGPKCLLLMPRDDAAPFDFFELMAAASPDGLPQLGGGTIGSKPPAKEAK